MSTGKSYACFSEQGKVILPDQTVIDNCYQDGFEPIIFLDSCVCLHIIKVVDYRKAATNVDFAKILDLKKYLEKHPGIRVDPFFALLELCNNKSGFDQEKLQDFKYRVDFFQQVPYKALKSFKYDFYRDYFPIRVLKGTLGDPSSAISLLQKNSYCSLLKIRSLALQGLGKENAEKNIGSFLDWMTDELDSIMGVEYKLALNIFGGNTSFRKMIALDCKQSNIRKKILGTCWDIFHARHTSNGFRLQQLLGRSIKPYFITSDSNLFNIFKNFSLRLIKDGGDDFVSSFILNSDFNIPHLTEGFIDRQNNKMMDIFIERRNQPFGFNENSVNQIIKVLELENGIT